MRLLVHVEGKTEETFVRDVLAPRLTGCGYVSVGARLVGSRVARAQRGGAVPWPSVRDRIVGYLKEDRQAFATTMVDYYGMPQSGPRAWPGRAEARACALAERAAFVQNAVAQDIAHHMGVNFDRRRFMPYVSMHEFEALLFSNCRRFAESVGHPEIAGEMEAIVIQFGGPEAIDDSRETAPSKRILRLLPGYRKVAMGATAIQNIGLVDIRSRCANFAEWLRRLEAPVTPIAEG